MNPQNIKIKRENFDNYFEKFDNYFERLQIGHFFFFRLLANLQIPTYLFTRQRFFQKDIP